MENGKYKLKFELNSLGGSSDQIAYISSFDENTFDLKIYHGYQSFFINEKYLPEFCSGLGIDYKGVEQQVQRSNKNPWYYYLNLAINDTNQLQGKIYGQINSLSDENNKKPLGKELDQKQTNKYINTYSKFGIFICECIKKINDMKDKLKQDPNAKLEIINITIEFNRFIGKDN